MFAMLLKLIVRQPSLLLNHARAYADLAVEETRRLTRHWRTRALLYGASFLCFNLGLVLGGVALMLWAVLPETAAQTSWVLLALPLLCEAMALAFFLAAQSREPTLAFAVMQEQLKLDVLALREARSARTR
jgi:Na+/melibiose symporter-like transporter